MCPAGPWNEGRGGDGGPQPCWPGLGEQRWRTGNPGQQGPTFLTQPKVCDLQETLGIQQKVIQLQVPEGKGGRSEGPWSITGGGQWLLLHPRPQHLCGKLPVNDLLLM